MSDTLIVSPIVTEEKSHQKKLFCIIVSIIVVFALAATGVLYYFLVFKKPTVSQPKSTSYTSETKTSSKSSYLVNKDKVQILGSEKPVIQTKKEYTILLLGDSMVDTLRTHDTILIDILKEYYQNKEFKILNYGFGSTNIISVKDRIEKETDYQNNYYPPIKNVDYDIIFVESFGHNPLSQYPINSGLDIQTKELGEIYNSLKEAHPDSRIVFFATISPNKKLYGSNNVDLSEEDRIKWAEERISYIKNHIQFAKDNGIQILNIFEKSLTENGDGNLRYISDVDYIHPSAEGVYFIYEEIGKFIIENKLLPE